MTSLIRSVRRKGVKGVIAKIQKRDPAFDFDGLPNPFSVYFPVLIHNGHSATLYVGAVLVSPPAGWTDSEDNLGSVGAGANLYTEKNNTTRATPTAGSSETITLRINYYTDVVGGTLLGYDDFSITIYWESVAAGTIDDTDDFEVDLEGWTKTDEAGGSMLTRSSAYSISGANSMWHTAIGSGDTCYLQKTLTMGSGTRAYIFGYLRPETSGASRPLILEIITPVETVLLPFPAPAVWRRFGARLNPGVSNQVRLRAIGAGMDTGIYYDLIRWVRY